MKKLISFDTWLKVLTFLVLLSITAYASAMAYEYYLLRNNLYEVIDIEDCVNSDIIFEDISDQELDKLFGKKELNRMLA